MEISSVTLRLSLCNQRHHNPPSSSLYLHRLAHIDVRLPEHCNCGTPELLALAAPPAPVVAQRRAYRQPVPWDFWTSCTTCTVGTRLCCTTGVVRQTEDELNLRILQLELVDCWDLSLKSIGTSTTGISTVCCTVASLPQPLQSRICSGQGIASLILPTLIRPQGKSQLMRAQLG